MDIDPGNLLGWRTVLVPTDFSECSEAALETGHRLASSVGGRILLLHVIEVSGGLDLTTRLLPEGAREPITVERYAREGALARLEEEAERIPTSVRRTIGVAFGRPAEAILRAIVGSYIDVVVLGTHGRKGLRKALLGSVAEKVVRDSPVPVLTVRHVEEPAGEESTFTEALLEDERDG